MNRFPKVDYASAREWHIYHAYTDPEFVREYQALVKYIETSKPKGDVNEYDYMSNEVQQRVEALAKHYEITVDDLNFYHLEYDIQGYPITDRPFSVKYNDVTKHIEVSFNPRMVKADFDKVWDEIEVIKTELLKLEKTAPKPPKHHQLLYAIFKAKQKRWKIGRIYELYDEGILPYFVQPLSEQGRDKEREFMSAKDLQDYYDSFRPKSTPV